MRGRLAVGVIALGALVSLSLAGAAVTYFYFFSSARSSPKPLSLGSAAPSTPATPAAGASASPASAATPAAGQLAGKWTVAQPSQAGYRVSETFVNQSSAHDAVARTSDVTGSLTVQQASSGLQATSLTFTAQLSSLKSVDQVAGRDVSLRDGIVSQSLNVRGFPSATFTADSVTPPADVAGGATATITVPGKLTIHGTTRDVQATVQARLNGSQVEVAGSIATAMTDFGVSPPQIGFTVVQPQVTIEFQLVLARAAV